MASQGPLSGGTFVNDNTVGTPTWLNPANAASSNDLRAIATFNAGGQTSQYLKATNFGFTIPAGATIDGIVVEVERSVQTTFGSTSTTSCKIVKGGSIVGNDNNDASTSWPTTDAYVTYGGASDLWGVSWTASDINDSTFGFVISATGFSDSARIDHVRITVHYTPAPPPAFRPLLMRLQPFWRGAPFFGAQPNLIPEAPAATVLLPDLLDHTRAIFAPTVSPQLLPARLDHSRSTFSPKVSPQLRPARIDHTRQVFALDLDVTLLPARIDHTRSTFSPTVSPQLRPARIDHTRTMFSPTVSGGVITLLPARIDHSRSTFSPTVSPQLRPARIDQTRSIFASTVSPQLRPARIDHVRSTFAPKVIVVITPARIDHTRTMFAPRVSPQLRPARIDHARAIFAPGIPAPPGVFGDDVSTRTLPLLP